MVLLGQGINRFRDLIYADLKEGELGSDGTEVYLTDTDIGSAIPNTLKTLTAITFNKGLKIDYTTDAGDGDGSSAREWVMTCQDDNKISRCVFPQIDITNTTLISVTTQILIIQEI